MKRIFTISLVALIAAGLSAKTTGTQSISSGHYGQNHTPVTQLQPDEYMSNTLIIKVLPEYRSKCTNGQIAIPAVVNFFTMIGADNIKKIYPLKSAPEKATNKFGAPMIDLSLIYEVHYSGALQLETAIGKLYNM